MPNHSLSNALTFTAIAAGTLATAVVANRWASPLKKDDPINDLKNNLNSSSGVIISTDLSDLRKFMHPPGTNHNYLGVVPLAVIYPTCTSDVQEIVKVARKHGIHIISISAQSSLEGHTINLYPNTFLISFQNMSNIIAIHPDDGDAVVQPGVAWIDLNAKLKADGVPLFFPVDPSKTAQFGGMISTGGSGTNAVCYGAIGNHILNVTAVLADGSVLKTRSRARKSAMGYDLTKLFVGSEGTLGIITEATVRLSPLQPNQVAIAAFNDVNKAVEAVVKILQSPIQVHCLELLDEYAMRAINLGRQDKLDDTEVKHAQKHIDPLPELPSLWFKFSGSPGAVNDNINGARNIVKENNGNWVIESENDEDSEAIWNDRKNIFWSQQKLVPGCQVYITDNCVPISNMPELVNKTKVLLKESGFMAPLIAHAGDGNFHAALLVSSEQSMEDAIKVAKTISEIAIELDGTSSGEHGVGLSKIKFLEKELGSGTVQVMRSIKNALDPTDMFNPGKLLA